MRKSLITPKSIALLRKGLITLKSIPIIAKRFNYAELYQAYGHYTLTQQGLEPINFNEKNSQKFDFFIFEDRFFSLNVSTFNQLNNYTHIILSSKF